jgi:hypothetical protein
MKCFKRISLSQIHLKHYNNEFLVMASWLARDYKYPTNRPMVLPLSHLIAKAIYIECDKEPVHNEELEFM